MSGRRTISHGDRILSEIADLLIEQNGLLRGILSRLPEQQPTPSPVAGGGPVVVDVQEPAKRRPGRPRKNTVKAG